MSIEDRVLAHMRAGTLRHFSIIKTAQGYQANFANAASAYKVDIRADPVLAMRVVLGDITTLDANILESTKSPLTEPEKVDRSKTYEPDIEDLL